MADKNTTGVQLDDDAELVNELAKLEQRSVRFKRLAMAAGAATGGVFFLACVWLVLCQLAVPLTTFKDLHIPAEILNGLSDRVSAALRADEVFSSPVSRLVDVLTGTAGKIFTILALGAALAMGVIRQSLGHVVIGIAMALGPMLVLPILKTAAGAGDSMGDAIASGESPRRIVERLLDDKEWTKAIDALGPLDDAKKLYLTSQHQFIVYQDKLSKSPSNEKPAAQAMFVSTSSVPSLTKAQLEKANWGPDASRVYVMEKAVFGVPQSDFAKKYEKDLADERGRSLSRAALSGVFGLPLLLTAAGLAGFALSLRRRVERIRSLMSPRGRTAPIPEERKQPEPQNSALESQAGRSADDDGTHDMAFGGDFVIRRAELAAARRLQDNSISQVGIFRGTTRSSDDDFAYAAAGVSAANLMQFRDSEPVRRSVEPAETKVTNDSCVMGDTGTDYGDVDSSSDCSSGGDGGGSGGGD